MPLGKRLRIRWLWAAVLLLGLGVSLGGEAGGAVGLFSGNPMISFGPVDPARPPVVLTGGTQLLIISPQDRWTLSIEARGDLVNKGRPEVTIPVSRLAWSVNDGGPPSWTPLEAYTPQTVSGPADPTDQTGELLRIDYRLSPSWDDPPLPWEYTTELCFTLSPDLEPLHSWVHPTPFMPGSEELLTIGYYVPGSGPLEVRLQITDADGILVAEISTTQEGGQWQEICWDGTIVDGAGGADQLIWPGIYYYRISLAADQRIIAAGIIDVAHHSYAGQSRVYGKVLRAGGEEGLQGAHVVLYTRERRQAASCITSEDGSYRLAYLPAGEYYLEASLPGYLGTVSNLFYLDGYEEKEICLELLPNRGLDLDLQLSAKTVEVGGLLGITLQLTNSGTRDLLGAAAELRIPQGFAYAGGRAEEGQIRIEQGEGAGARGKLKWEVGPLGQGESLWAEVWLLAGLDVIPISAKIQAQAAGFTQTERLDTGVVSQLVDVTSGTFTAASPRTFIDAHLFIPLGETASLELRLEPDPAAAHPAPPLSLEPKQVTHQRNPLVPTADPLRIKLGDLPPHGLRIRAEGSSWAVEGGSWHHWLPPGYLPLDQLAAAGVQGALQSGDVVFRGFYGVPETWPHFKLFPADNTSGPFALPRPLPTPGSVDVKVLSWDSLRGVWQEEGPVVFRVDYSQGTVTLGRAVSSHNDRGDKQYILVTYTYSGLTGSDAVWKEAGITLTKPKLGIAVNYLEAGQERGLKLGGIRGRFSDNNLVVHASLQTTLDYTLVTGSDMEVKPDGEDNQKPYDQPSLLSRSAWQLLGALEVYPGLRLGGGWREEGSEHLGFWGITGREGGAAPSTSKNLTRLLHSLWDQIDSSTPRAQLGMGPLALEGKESRRWALGLEMDLTEAWWASFTAKREELAAAVNDAAGPQGVGPYGARIEVSSGWEQRFNYEAPGLPRWSLGYGRKAGESCWKEQSHYGLIEAGGELHRLEWQGKISLLQDLAGYGGNQGLEGEKPIQAAAELSAEYGGGRLRPRIKGRLGSSWTGADWLTQREFQEWSIGFDGDINDRLTVSFVHTDRESYSSTDSYSQAVSLSACYSKSDSLSLGGKGEWVRGDVGEEPRWQGELELEARLDSNLTLKLGWSATDESAAFQGDTRERLDRFAVTLSQEEAAGLWTERELLLGATFKGATSLAWEAAAEGTLNLEPWEIWSRAAAKSVESPLTGQLVTRQGVIRLSRRLQAPWAAFIQLGAWQQLDKAEAGWSLGVSCEIAPGFNVTAGYTWPVHWGGGERGYLSLQPGLFIQLFGR